MPDGNNETAVIYETATFDVRVTEANDPVFQEATQMYGIFNKETGVREAEARRLVNAKALCDILTEDLESNNHSLQRAFPAMPNSGGTPGLPGIQ